MLYIISICLQWASSGYGHGPESPTSSSVSSPGSKPTPVNFDYKPIIADAVSVCVCVCLSVCVCVCVCLCVSVCLSVCEHEYKLS